MIVCSEKTTYRIDCFVRKWGAIRRPCCCHQRDISKFRSRKRFVPFMPRLGSTISPLLTLLRIQLQTLGVHLTNDITHNLETSMDGEKIFIAKKIVVKNILSRQFIHFNSHSNKLMLSFRSFTFIILKIKEKSHLNRIFSIF